MKKSYAFPEVMQPENLSKTRPLFGSNPLKGLKFRISIFKEIDKFV